MESRKLVIGFLSKVNPEDKKASSGTCYMIARQLSNVGEVRWIPVRRTLKGALVSACMSRVSRLCGRTSDFYSTMLGSEIGFEYDEALLESCDIVAAFFCMPVLARLKTSKPVIYFTDATYPAMVDYYFLNRWSFNNVQGVRLEQMAMDNASAVVLASGWAARSARRDLNVPVDKINVVEYGANIDDNDITYRNRNILPESRPKILFLGVDWTRKGGEIALCAVEYLKARGIQATLHVVGIKNLDDNIKYLPYVEDHGFLNKNVPSEYRKIVDLMNQSDILLLPTLAECSAIAFSEACGFGLPVFSHDTGGVGNYVIDGVNGYKLPLGSEGEDFGAKIKETILSGEISRLSEGARRLYTDKLNWNTWGESVGRLVRSLVQL